MNLLNRLSLIFAFFLTLSFAAFAQNATCPACDDPANCSKFVFEFVPEKVVAAPGETLKVEIQKWRTAKWLNEATRLQPNRCPEDRDISAPLDKIHIPTSNWVVIVQDGKTYTNEQYLPPLSDPTRHPGYKRTIPISKAVVRTVGDTELADADVELSDLPEGEYWFTLQNIANINDGERCEVECNKTTPPVKIIVKYDQIKVRLDPDYYGPVSFNTQGTDRLKATISYGIGPYRLEWYSTPGGPDLSKCPDGSDSNIVFCDVPTGNGLLSEGATYQMTVKATDKNSRAAVSNTSRLRINNVPTIKLEVEPRGKDCFPLSITAHIYDKDNDRGSDVPRQDLTIGWFLHDINGNRIEIPTDRKITKGENSETLTISSGLLTGDHSLRVMVNDGLDRGGDTTSLNVVCDTGGAGIIYFQFDESKINIGRKERVSNRRGKEVKCEYPYPEEEFPDFYLRYNARMPTTVELNTDKLDRIADRLKEYPDAVLYIFSYADYKGGDRYNVRLGLRRLNAAKLYLAGRGINKNRIRIETKNFGESKAKSCKEQNCSQERKHDRRVELIYKFGGTLKPVEYPFGGCEETDLPSAPKGSQNRPKRYKPKGKKGR